MADETTITPEQIEAFDQIRRIFREHGETNWNMPPEIAIQYAQELADVPPDQVRQKAREILQKLKDNNTKEKQKREKAKERVAALKANSITNLGRPGLIGYLQRSIMASINGTPLNALNWMEVNDKGLQVYTPLAPVSQRTFKQRDLAGNRVVLSVDPPAYFDALIGLLKQLRINFTTPWGQIIVYEPSSGRNLGEAVALWPDRKIKEFRDALMQIHLVENPFEGYQRLPRMVDLLGYHVEEWDLKIADQQQAANQAGTAEEEEDEE